MTKYIFALILLSSCTVTKTTAQCVDELRDVVGKHYKLKPKDKRLNDSVFTLFCDIHNNNSEEAWEDFRSGK